MSVETNMKPFPFTSCRGHKSHSSTKNALDNVTQRTLTENEAALALKFISSSRRSTSRLPLYELLRNSTTTAVEGGFPAFFDLSDYEK